jgi:membrane-bound lytic murein transglycosylase D
MKTMMRKKMWQTMGLIAALLIVAVHPAAAATDPFPVFDCIEGNVAFWTQVYSQYTTAQGIVHDSDRLDIIYDIIDLLPYDAPQAHQINGKRMKKAVEKYERILNRLAHAPEAEDAESRRVAALFGPAPDDRVFRKAARQVRCQTGQKDRFAAGLVRSGAYLDEIRAIFRSYDLPPDLAYLPHVESSFNPNAYSKFGAAGVWQFTRSTGQRFMRVGYALDERRDPFRASHAAAQLLKENYEKLGSWPLALTAYNHGAAGMERARSLHGEYPEIFKSYHSRTFKFASRNFYSEFLAARRVAGNYQAYFGALKMEQPLPARTIVLDGYVALGDLCNYFQLSPEVVRQMNPALRAPVVNGQKHIPKGYALRLPKASGGAENLMLAGMPASIYKDSQKPSRFYTVRRGDTAARIARMHGVALSDLKLANNLNARAIIHPRQTLRIPLPGELLALNEQPQEAKTTEVLLASNASPQGDAQAAGAAEKSRPPAESVEPAPLIVPAETSVPAPSAEPLALLPPASPGPALSPPEPALTPQPETPSFPAPLLASILGAPAAVPPPEMADASDPAAGETPNAEIVVADVGFERILKIGRQPVGILRVEVEETLGHYAEWAGVRTRQIRHLNGLPFVATLRLHQQIKIPLNRVTAQAFEESRYEYHKRLQEDFFAVYQLGQPQPYRVQRGDSCWTLSRDKFEVPLWLLRNANPQVDFADLRPNQQIMIPTIAKVSADEPAAEEAAGETDDSEAPPSEENGASLPAGNGPPQAD